MKKFLIIAFFCATYLQASNDFKKAIIQSDMTQVKDLLNKASITPIEKKNLLKLAQNIKKLRFEAHIVGEKRYGFFSSPTSEILKSTKICWGITAALTGLILTDILKMRCNIWIDTDTERIGYKGDIFPATIPFIMIGMNAIKNYFEARELRSIYMNALEIEELITKAIPSV